MRKPVATGLTAGVLLVGILVHVHASRHPFRVVPFARSGLGAPDAPKLRLSEVQKMEPTSYRAELTLDPDKDRFSGAIHINLRVQEAAQTVWLNASKIAIETASLSTGAKSLTAKAVAGGTDFVGLQFDSLVPAGSADLEIHYTGEVRQRDSAGAFRVDDKGSRYIMTQFESTDARDVFPCFDEPSYKVPWQLTLHVPAHDTAVSNTPVTSDKTEGAVRTFVFGETKPLPSYLIAFGVGPFEYVDAGKAGKKHVPVRIVVPEGRANEAKYAAEVTATILTRLEEYFGIPYPYEKSDQMAVPLTIGFGAMENAGMVTYGQTILLAAPASDSINRQRGYAGTAAHELAHQWFGDLVTTAWWNDIWLNEAFATWMGQKLLAEWKPEWKTRVVDVASKLHAAAEDSLISARQIRQPIETKGDIGDAFDSITYDKGAAVIGMFENWIGAQKFRAGVQRYLKQHAFSTATASDFLDSLSAGGSHVKQAFSTFLDQPGVPMISVALDCAGPAKLHLEQKRFLPIGSKGSTDQVWSIPICIRYGSAGTGRSECALMTQSAMDWTFKDKSCPAWVQANAGAKGYYRTDYQGQLLSSLIAGDVVGRLPAPERVELIGNVSAVSGAGKLPAGDALALVEKFHADPEREIILRSLNVALDPRSDMVPDNLMPSYRRFLLKNFQAKARELGWTPRAGESDDVRLLRPPILRAVGTEGGDQDLARESRELAEKWLRDRSAVSPDVVRSVLMAAAYNGDRALFDRFFSAFNETQDRQQQQDLIIAMISFRDRSAIDAALELVPAGKIALPDGLPFLFGPGHAAPETRTLAFESLKAHFNEIMDKHPNVFGFDLGAFLPRVGEGFCDAQSRSDYAAFFEPKISRYEGAPRAYAQTLEGIDLCIARKQAQQGSVAAFLQKY